MNVISYNIGLITLKHAFKFLCAAEKNNLMALKSTYKHHRLNVITTIPVVKSTTLKTYIKINLKHMG